ncbi:MAG: MBL fold metallo-hydrolase [Burkholderiales bacterium 35-55-47]|jgi:glyoxylase-like metal-dependent hydrolase (beta-lactamase superfamily II)|uniref:MBL fold metallo-hydrolase n=1 Tax=Limnohabitans sp. TaxID=1907725 RepID=UPI000BD89272|nr:MBL fold metallo-hydrolase [Limnohabitans sp.]OYY18793.1 MAG: MBL fold metallo-hydrolase [Burkholderiales bacterium 35-55-47]OYZ73611.1 MAG: MBL fold metallo-hydrolase [Burkholderiales bacterium 24-55-52]OZB00757.1 MAG: MBL fold metallo-hydrolase [Burkholderiales bacterium 39-55-53]HQR85481.1 MBL fold metallo-hydrolase [Limnohabitans sp.]HQS26602.1 MBL fold metallo-hydrolase [Limnohabitans sp.]
MHIESFFDPATFTFSHIVWDSETHQCALIDSVLDYDPKSGRTQTTSADTLIARVRELGLTVQWLLETHVHADHLSAAPYLQKQLGGQLAIGSHITTVQNVFGKLFNAGSEFARDGSQFDRLLNDGDSLHVGHLHLQAMHTPGHTPACMTYVVRDTRVQPARQVAFVGDTLFMPDYGTARCDFPGGSASILFESIAKVLSLSDDTVLYMCHDYPPEGREPTCVTTVAEQKRANIHVHAGVTQDDFVAMREKRDATLSMPVLILPSVQVNMRAGQMPPAEDNGMTYLKIPVNAL